MSSAPTTVLVTGAGGPLGVNVTRSLLAADAGLRLVGTDANRWHLPLSLCERTYRIPRADEQPGYARALGEIAERERVAVIVPTHPVEVRAVARLRDTERLHGMRTLLPRTETLELCDDKLLTNQRLRAAGVPVPETVMLNAPEDIDDALSRLGAPVWIRGNGAPGLGVGGAALPCRDRRSGIGWVEHHGGWGRMSASALLPGDNVTWMGGFHRGRLLAAAARERLEYVIPHVSPSGITGAPAVSRTLSDPIAARTGEDAVRAVDPMPDGVYFVDMKGDADGTLCVTEINAGRCGTTVHFYTEAGFNFPELVVRLAMGEDVPALPDPNAAIPPDLYWVRTLDCGPVLVRGADGFERFPSA